jgi:hypothetical protein
MLREKKDKRTNAMNFYPAIKPLKYNKRLIKRLLALKVGDVIHAEGKLGNINVRETFPTLTPPYLEIKKMVIYIKDVEYSRHIDIEELEIDKFINILDDDYLKSLSSEEITKMEELLDKKLEEEVE